MAVLLIVPCGAAADEGRAAEATAAGRALFVGGAEPACGICHTLKDAGTSGEVGPALDPLAPSARRVAAAVTQGVGIMPAYADALDAEEIDAIARYVATATGGEVDL